MAALVVSAAGAWAGSAFGAAIGSAGVLGVSWAGIGWSVGGLLASSFQTQKVQGPRLNDLTVTGSAYGSPVPYVFGSPRISGQWIWSSQKREISTTTSRRAKGGPKIQSTNFTYEADMFLMLTSNEMEGVRRIWINGELQWTSADDSDFGSINASSALARRVTVYTGADDQLPDPTYEAAVGAGAPAYIGHLTIFFEALQLGTSGQIPNITVEVVSNGSLIVKTDELASSSVGAGSIPIAYSSDEYTTFSLLTSTTPVPTFAFTNVTASKTQFDPGAGTIGNSVTGAMVGRSDRPVFLSAGSFGSNEFHLSVLDGMAPRRFLFPRTPGVFVLSGSNLVVAETPATGGRVLRRYNLDDVTEGPAVNVTTSADVATLVIVGPSLFVHYQGANPSAQTVEVFDLETLMTTGEIITTPVGNGAAEILDGELGELLFLNTTQLWRYEPSGTWSLVMTVPTGYGAHNSTGRVDVANPYVRGGSLYTTRRSGSTTFVRVAWQAMQTGPVPLNQVVQELFGRVGIDPSDFDASALAPQSVRGYAISPTTTRAVMDVLAQAYHFECAPADKLVMVPLGGNVVATIPYDDLGTADFGNIVEDPLPLVMRNDIEQPGFVTVKYMNAANDGQPGAERSFRISTDSEAEMFVEVSILFMPSEAKQMADFIANLLQASLLSVQEISLQTKYTRIQPCDAALLTDRDGSTYRVRFQERDDASGIIKFKAVFDNQQAAVSNGVTDEDYDSTTQIRVASLTEWVYGDWPLFRDVDDNVGFYWAADGLGPFWPGAVLMESPDDVSYGQVSQIDERGVVGTTLNTLGTWVGGNLVDTGNSVRVNVGQGTLASITYAEQLAGDKNVFMVGAECVIARTVTYVSAGVYDLTDLLRGRQGTGWAVDTHASGERVALIQLSGIRRVAQDLSKLNIDFYYRAVTMGRLLESANPRIEANTGVSSKPWAPTNLTPVRSGSDLTPQWVRRTRLSENWLADLVPLGEEEQLWRVRRYTSNAFTTVAEEQEVSSVGGATFNSAPTPSYIGIAQWSARVGWGYELQGAI